MILITRVARTVRMRREQKISLELLQYSTISPSTRLIIFSALDFSISSSSISQYLSANICMVISHSIFIEQNWVFQFSVGHFLWTSLLKSLQGVCTVEKMFAQISSLENICVQIPSVEKIFAEISSVEFFCSNPFFRNRFVFKSLLWKILLFKSLLGKRFLFKSPLSSSGQDLSLLFLLEPWQFFDLSFLPTMYIHVLGNSKRKSQKEIPKTLIISAPCNVFKEHLLSSLDRTTFLRLQFLLVFKESRYEKPLNRHPPPPPRPPPTNPTPEPQPTPLTYCPSRSFTGLEIE